MFQIHQRNQVILGMLMVIGINLSSAITMSILISFFPQLFDFNSGFFWVPLFFLLLIGLTQVLYVIPLIIFLVARQRMEMVKGVIIGAAITFLLNGAGCFLLVTGVIG